VNKADLIAKVAAETDLTKDQAARAVEATFKRIEAALRGGDAVRIIGFGNFQVAQRKSTVGRNPRTGAEVAIPASKIPRFRAGRALRDAVFPPHGAGGGPDAEAAFSRPHGGGAGPDKPDPD